MSHPLAIIIPAYRAHHLGTALESLRQQTDQRFQLYVGDDASPDDLASLIASFRPKFSSFTYHRFTENLGGSDLTAHWHRCIQLSADEPWIWLFSDDDIAEPGCVADFYRALETAPQTNLYHFNIDIINNDGVVYERPQTHPPFETAQAHSQALITDRGRQWRAPDHIFSRRIYEETVGFVSFPRALYADFATWVKFSHPHGVRTIGPSRVRWRSHSQGTSSGQREKNRVPMIAALTAYLKWLTTFAASDKTQLRSFLRHRLPAYAYQELALFRPPLNRAERRSLAPALAQIFKTTRFRQQIALLLVSLKGHLRTTPLIRHLAAARYRRHMNMSKPPF